MCRFGSLRLESIYVVLHKTLYDTPTHSAHLRNIKPAAGSTVTTLYSLDASESCTLTTDAESLFSQTSKCVPGRMEALLTK